MNQSQFTHELEAKIQAAGWQRIFCNNKKLKNYDKKAAIFVKSTKIEEILKNSANANSQIPCVSTDIENAPNNSNGCCNDMSNKLNNYNNINNSYSFNSEFIKNMRSDDFNLLISCDHCWRGNNNQVISYNYSLILEEFIYFFIFFPFSNLNSMNNNRSLDIYHLLIFVKKGDEKKRMNKDSIVLIFIILMIVSLFVFSGGTSDSKILKNLKKQKEKAMHPRADRSLLRTEPRQGDLILGKQGEKYVCWDTQKDAHCLVIGGSGSGKSSSLVLPFLLNNPDTPVLAVDIKGELVKKGRYMNDPRICIFSPQNHNNYGFDVFYGLTKNSSQQEILETMQIVTFSLIPLGNTKDSYWAISARNMLTGLLIYYYNCGRHNIIFINNEGRKIRDSNLAKTFNIDISKEVLINEFERHKQKTRTIRTNPSTRRSDSAVESRKASVERGTFESAKKKSKFARIQ